MSSSIPQIRQIGFWTWEYRIPLFRLSDPKHEGLSDDVLCLYKKSVCHLYHLNEKSARGSK